MGNINFHYTLNNFKLKNTKFLKENIVQILNYYTPNITIDGISFVFCSDKDILKINKEYLGHNYYTDIITFDLSENGSYLFSEIYISIERVRENSIINNEYFKTEILRVIIHGILHLVGFKDIKKNEKRKMRNVENYWIEKIVSRETQMRNV